jgi:hypothetical protein|uniref:Uncharacterized protein n=1 Tax=viral metagenome TaxID=1070528 RepID=A0A6C0DZ61_9ZZZZ
MNKFFRYFPKNYPELDWEKTDKHRWSKCHSGQRKLFFSELEFLTRCGKYYKFDECCVLYVGAAPGTHTNLLIKMFPDLHWVLYDPNQFDINQKYINKNVDIHTGYDGFFTDDKIQDVLNNKFVKNRKILFICDMRLDTKQEQILKELIDQQRWIIKMGASMWSLKMRVPYNFDEITEYDMSDIKDKIYEYDSFKIKPGYLLYLYGNIVTQLYAKPYSTEMRLIGKIKKNGKYKFKLWHNKTYESNCLYFNEVDRYNDFIYDKSNLVPEHLLEYTNNYEHVGEYYIVKKYLKIFKDENDFPATIKAMYKINNELRQLTHRDFYTCINWTIKDEIKDIKKLNKTKNDIDKIIKDYKEYYEKYKKYIIEQKKVLEKTKKTNPILEQKEYDEQIEKVSKIIDYIDNISSFSLE